MVDAIPSDTYLYLLLKLVEVGALPESFDILEKNFFVDQLPVALLCNVLINTDL